MSHPTGDSSVLLLYVLTNWPKPISQPINFQFQPKTLSWVMQHSKAQNIAHTNLTALTSHSLSTRCIHHSCYALTLLSHKHWSRKLGPWDAVPHVSGDLLPQLCTGVPWRVQHTILYAKSRMPAHHHLPLLCTTRLPICPSQDRKPAPPAIGSQPSYVDGPTHPATNCSPVIMQCKPSQTCTSCYTPAAAAGGIAARCPSMPPCMQGHTKP